MKRCCTFSVQVKAGLKRMQEVCVSCSTTAPTPASDASVVRVRRVCGLSLMYDSLVKFTSAVFAALNAWRASVSRDMFLFFLCSRFVRG